MKNLKLGKKKIYGQELILDLFDCDPKIIRSKKKILEYSNQLCDLIKVKKHGKPIIRRFGFKKAFITGYSLAQLIESSLVSGHFSELWNRAFVNVFSCKSFNIKKVKGFTKKFFKAKKIKSRTLIR